jgi:lipopolysaccharide export system permease protein
VKLLTRYVIREHVGPLVFALSALTSLLMLQYVARKLADLAGKGLPWGVIGKWFALSLPFTIAMTLPMAVLVATLYAFGRMAAEHEITAFKASGVRVRTLMAPVILCAFGLSLFMVWFNDQLLPRTNHELRILTGDIMKTKPTLALREQAMNPITDQFFLRVARTNAATNRMYDVTIYDLRKGAERQTIYADSGAFLLSPNGQDLQLQLYDGYAQEFVRADPRQLQRSFFRTQTVQLRGIVRQFESTEEDTYRGDREQSVCQMHREYMRGSQEFERVRREYIDYASRLAEPGAKGITVSRGRPAKEPLAAFYCETVIGGLTSLFLPRKAAAQATDGAPQDTVRPPQDTTRPPPVVTPQPGTTPRPDSAVTPIVPEPVEVTTPLGQDVLPAAPGVPLATPDTVTDSVRAAQAAQYPVALVDTTTIYKSALMATSQQVAMQRESLDQLAVEIHKKFALSFACLVFVLFGPPIALRFPRGGVGVTLGVSIVVFGLYYICLMGGEALADKGRVPAYVAMWVANVIFAIVGIALLWRVESTTDTSRGGGLADWWADRKARRQLARELQASARTVTS